MVLWLLKHHILLSGTTKSWNLIGYLVYLVDRSDDIDWLLNLCSHGISHEHILWFQKDLLLLLQTMLQNLVVKLLDLLFEALNLVNMVLCLLLYYLVLFSQSISLELVLVVLVDHLLLKQHFLLKFGNLGLMVFCLQLFLNFRFQNIPFILQPSPFASCKIFVLDLHFEFEKLSSLVFFQVAEVEILVFLVGLRAHLMLRLWLLLNLLHISWGYFLVFETSFLNTFVARLCSIILCLCDYLFSRSHGLLNFFHFL